VTCPVAPPLTPAPAPTPRPPGVGLSFGADVTRSFLDANGLDLLVRSHEVKEEGYEVRGWEGVGGEGLGGRGR
jgi:hypothetical protein